MQAGGIELILPASNTTGQQRSFAMRETTDNSAPSFMFADLEGRLSASSFHAPQQLCSDSFSVQHIYVKTRGSTSDPLQ